MAVENVPGIGWPKTLKSTEPFMTSDLIFFSLSPPCAASAAFAQSIGVFDPAATFSGTACFRAGPVCENELRPKRVISRIVNSEP